MPSTVLIVNLNGWCLNLVSYTRCGGDVTIDRLPSFASRKEQPSEINLARIQQLIGGSFG